METPRATVAASAAPRIPRKHRIPLITASQAGTAVPERPRQAGHIDSLACAIDPHRLDTTALTDVNIDVKLVDSDNVVNYHDSDIKVGGVMAYTGKVTSAESLGRILQQARLLSGLSQRELARRLGTTQKYIWELEAGKPSIMMDRLFAAMRETGMELTATITPPGDEHG